MARREAALGVLVGGLGAGRLEQAGQGGVEFGRRVAGAIRGVEEALVVSQAAQVAGDGVGLILEQVGPRRVVGEACVAGRGQGVGQGVGPGLGRG